MAGAKQRWLSLIGAAGIVLVFAGTSFAGEEPPVELKRILADWEKRRAAIGSVRYELVGEVYVPKGRYSDEESGGPGKSPIAIPDKDTRFEKKVTLLLEFNKNWLRHEERSLVMNGTYWQFRPYYEISTYDGSRYKSYTPREENTSAGIPRAPAEADLTLGKELSQEELDKRRGPFFEADEWPVFFGHGIPNFMPTPRRNLKETSGLDHLRVHGTAIQDQQPRIVLRTPADQYGWFYEIWVDLQRESAITKVIAYRPEGVGAVHDIQYQETSHGWMPFTWTATMYYEKNQIDRVIRQRVVKVDFDIPISAEDLQLERDRRPGMVVRDENTQPSSLFVVQQDGSLSPVQVGPDGQLVTPSRWRWIALGIVLSAILLAGSLLIWRHFARRGKMVGA